MIISYTDKAQHCIMDESTRPYEDNEKKVEFTEDDEKFFKNLLKEKENS